MDHSTEGEAPFDVRLTPKQSAVFEAAALETWNILSRSVGAQAPMPVLAAMASAMFPMCVRRIVENENA